MSLVYRKLPDLTPEEKQHYLKLVDCQGWINHKSTKSGLRSVLHFLPCEYKNFKRVALMKMEPHAIQDWHIDGNRKCVAIYPLSENYAKGMTREGEYEGPVLLDVTQEHAVYNNEYTRVCLQISFDESMEEVWDSLLKN